MTIRCFLLLLIPAFGLLQGCGYHRVALDSEIYQTVNVRPVQGSGDAARLAYRLRDALLERLIAGSGIRPVDGAADLQLQARILSYQENVIATGADGRTRDIQFNIRADFFLLDAEEAPLWSLRNYQYSDQYQISTTAAEFRDETFFTIEDAMNDMADLVISNLTLAIARREQERTEPTDGAEGS